MAKVTYPETFKAPHVVATLSDDVYLISFAFFREALPIVKALPGAKWDRQRKCWIVKRRWHAKIGEAVTQISDVITPMAEAKAQMSKDAIALLDPYDPYIYIGARTGAILVVTPYDRRIIDICRGMGGKWTGEHWQIERDRIDQVLAKAQEIVEIAREAEAKIAAQTAARREAAAQQKAEREAQREARREAAKAAAAPALPRMAIPLGSAKVGDVIRLAKVFTVASLGKPFFCSYEDTSAHGLPADFEGRAQYATLRPATDDEIATLEAAEAAAAERREARDRARAALRTVFDGEVAPQLGAEPEGQILYANNRHALTGYRTSVILADGWLYGVTYDGSDGASFEQRNLGYCTHGHRVPATDALIADIRAAAEMET